VHHNVLQPGIMSLAHRHNAGCVSGCVARSPAVGEYIMQVVGGFLAAPLRETFTYFNQLGVFRGFGAPPFPEIHLLAKSERRRCIIP